MQLLRREQPEGGTCAPVGQERRLCFEPQYFRPALARLDLGGTAGFKVCAAEAGKAAPPVEVCCPGFSIANLKGTAGHLLP